MNKPNEVIYLDYYWSIEIYLKGKHAGCWSFYRGIGKQFKGLTHMNNAITTGDNYCTIQELLTWLPSNKPEVYEKYRIILDKLAKGVTK